MVHVQHWYSLVHIHQCYDQDILQLEKDVFQEHLAIMLILLLVVLLILVVLNV